MMEKEKIPYKSVDDRIIAGVCAGLAEYFDIDKTLVRLIWAAFSCMYGIGIVLYAACMLFLEDEPDEPESEVGADKEAKEDGRYR